MPAVSDSSPLILLSAIGQLELLHRLFGEVMVPPAVLREVVDSGRGRPGALEIARLGWVRRLSPPAVGLPLPVARLGGGDAEAIALARALPPEASIILDDLPARRIAGELGRSVTGTGGVLVVAKQERLIREVGPLLVALQAHGLYLSDAAAHRLLDLAGERS